jgi:hypothetical protein
MESMWCELRAQIKDGRLVYRGIVRCGTGAVWRGPFRERKHDAIADAERSAEKLYGANSHQLKFAATAGPWPTATGPGLYRRAGTGPV